MANRLLDDIDVDFLIAILDIQSLERLDGPELSHATNGPTPSSTAARFGTGMRSQNEMDAEI